MSEYETASIALSVIAISLSILIPLVQWVYKKWIPFSKLQFYPTGQVTLFFNQSGSYLRLNGVIESEKSAVTIKKLDLVITRKRDDHKLKLTWSYFISPVNQSMLGNYINTVEAAHPFRVEMDSIACAFVEYSDPSDSSGIKIRKACSDLIPTTKRAVSESSYDEAVKIFCNSHEYLEAKNVMASEFFWEIGKYTVAVSIEYDKKKNKSFSYHFIITEQNSMDLRANIDELLLMKLKEYYRQPSLFKTPLVELNEV